jgi:hypothetical protein
MINQNRETEEIGPWLLAIGPWLLASNPLRLVIEPLSFRRSQLALVRAVGPRRWLVTGHVLAKQGQTVQALP